MTNVELVLQKLSIITEHVARVRRRRPETLQEFAASVDLQDALSMSLLVAIQEAIDVAFHMAADEGWGIPRSYRDGFAKLSEHGVIDADLAEALAGVASLRNRLAHGYATVEFERLWTEAPNGADQLAAFARAVAARFSL